MSLDRVPAGKDVPNDCNVIIEIPMRADPIKYEVDKETGAVFVDRFMSTAMHYPCNYGYIPRTLSDDGDPCDVLVLSPMPLITGVVVRCRPIGMLKMDDEAGGDSKILAVPIDKLSSLYRDVKSPRDLPEITTQQIAHFFEHYKDLEPGKWVRVADWVGAEEAKREILDGVARYEAANPQAERPDRDGDGRARAPAARVSRSLFVVLWSTGFIAAKYGLAYAPPFKFLLYRFVLVAALMGAVALATRARVAVHARGSGCTSSSRLARPWRLPGRRARRDRERHVGGNGGDARRPAADLTVLLARGWLGERVVPRQWVGLVLGLAGVWLVVRHKVVFTADGKALGAILIALVGISVGTLYQKRHCSHVDLRSGAVIQFFACAIAYVPIVVGVRAGGADPLDARLRLRARLVGGGAVGRRDQPALLAAAARRGVERRGPFLPRSAGRRP